jgi:uncharacterized repeat protein (TIGR01451 family)
MSASFKSCSIGAILAILFLLIISLASQAASAAPTTSVDKPPLIAEKQVLSSAAPGAPLSYQVTITNTADISVTGVTMTDTLPSQVSYLPGSIMTSKGDSGYASGVITWTVSLDPNEIAWVTYKTVVNNDTPIGTPLVNQAVISDGTEVFTRTATTNVDFYHVYLPVAVKTQPGIQGYVTLNGAPASGVPLDLRLFNGSGWSTAITTTTNSVGYYAFENAASLQEGQAYYVLYSNKEGTPGRLWLWGTGDLTSYAAGGSVNMGDFDIADIELVAPADGASLTLPGIFQWTPRPATPADTYKLRLYDGNHTATSFFTDPSLGYVDRYTLNSLPAGFNFGTPYDWEIWVDSPDGGSGVSREYRQVTINGLAGSPAGLTQRPFQRVNCLETWCR